jgi:ferredoxin
MAHKEQGYRFRIDYDFDHRKKVVDDIDQIVVFPVSIEIKKDQTVLNFDKVKKIIDSAIKIAVMDCSCRSDLKRCDAPVDTCMTFDEHAEEMLTSEDARIRSYKPHPVSHDGAMEVLRRSTEAGLVHLAYIGKDSKDGKIGTICSCCSCCCEPLGGILRFGMSPHLLKASALTSTDESRCTGCGVCVDRCHFGARKIKDGVLTFEKNRCYGCGLCVSTCPTSAISLHQLSS